MTQINVRVDDEVKRQAEETFDELGLSLSTAIVIFLKKAGREKRIPFEVSLDPFYSDENMAELRHRINSVKNGTSVLKEHEMIEVDE